MPWVSPKDMKQFLVKGSEDSVTAKALDRLSLISAASVLVVVRSGILSRTLPVAINLVPVTINQDMRAFIPSRSIEPRYVAWQLIANERDILDQCSKDGTTVASIEGPALTSYPFAIAPAAEQTRIVDKLEELLSDLDAGVAELKAAQKKLAQYRQSLLKAAVEGHLTSALRKLNGAPEETGAELLTRILRERQVRWEAKQHAKFSAQGRTPGKGWQDRYPKPVPPDESALQQLPDGWTWASLDQCALDEEAITDGPFGSNLKSEHYTEQGPRVIRLQNIGDGVFMDSRAHISSSHFASLQKHAVCAGDLVIAMLGEVLPRACVVPIGVAPAIVKADCARVRANGDLISPTLLCHFLCSEPTRTRVTGLVKGIGRPRVNLGSLRSIPIPIPPLGEQERIKAILEDGAASIADQFNAIELSLKQAAAQRKNILKAAFAGQLVPQDANDEPASLLLERIRAERAARPAAGMKKRGRRALVAS